MCLAVRSGQAWDRPIPIAAGISPRVGSRVAPLLREWCVVALPVIGVGGGGGLAGHSPASPGDVIPTHSSLCREENGRVNRVPSIARAKVGIRPRKPRQPRDSSGPARSYLAGCAWPGTADERKGARALSRAAHWCGSVAEPHDLDRQEAKSGSTVS